MSTNIQTRDPGFKKYFYRFTCREILKWKYCYLENNPREYEKYYECRKRFKAYHRSMKFKKLFRLHMDDDYYTNMLGIQRHLLKKELKKLNAEELNDGEDADSGFHAEVAKARAPPVPRKEDQVKLLINYDKEVANAVRKIDQNFMVYHQFPKCYPEIKEEKEIFMKKVLIVKTEKEMDPKELDADFQKYWDLRIKILRSQAIEKEKEEIRRNWQDLKPRYEGIENDMETLLISDDDDDDCMIVESSYT